MHKRSFIWIKQHDPFDTQMDKIYSVSVSVPSLYEFQMCHWCVFLDLNSLDHLKKGEINLNCFEFTVPANSDLTRPLSFHRTLYQRIGESCSLIRFIDKEETVIFRSFPRFPISLFSMFHIFDHWNFKNKILSLVPWIYFIIPNMVFIHFFSFLLLRIISSMFVGNHYILIVDWLCTIPPCRLGRRFCLIFHWLVVFLAIVLGFPSVHWFNLFCWFVVN